MEKTEIVGGAIAKGELVRAEKGVRRGDSTSREPRSSTEKCIHQPMDYLRAETGEAPWRNGEIRQEPGGIGSGSASKLRNQGIQFIRAEAIEKEMCDDEIKRGYGRGPGECIGMNKGNLLEGEGHGALTIFRQAKHSTAGIDASDCRIRETLPKRSEELTGAYAQDENGFWSREVMQVRGPTALKLAPSKQGLHPRIMRRQGVETHRDETGSGLRCHQRKATTAPKV